MMKKNEVYNCFYGYTYEIINVCKAIVYDSNLFLAYEKITVRFLVQ